MRHAMLSALCAALAIQSTALMAGDGDPLWKKLSPEEAKALFYKTSAEGCNTPFKPNGDPGARWYPKAGFGLFIHWGIYAQAPVNPSWAMITDCFGKKRPAKISPEDYYALAKVFNPKKDAPEIWLEMAKSMKMRYAVMTTKHHDGYCMWPTKYGEYNTGKCMGGRDLVAEYVAACRKNGLKVGFYFSPRDWSYNNFKSMFKQPSQHFKWFAKPEWPYKTKEENEKAYKQWLDYTVGQLSELLTRYGKIDLLWFDGVGWHGISRPEDDRRVRNWIYKLQPQIVINPRWGGKNINPDYKNHKGKHNLAAISRKIGDFYTFESKWDDIEKRNEGLYADIWFEFCKPWKGHWGHVPATSAAPDHKSVATIIYRLTILRSFGGNFLLNVGPDKNGDLRPDIISESKIIAKWMEKSAPALVGNDPVKYWEAYSNAPLTKRGKTLYAHLPTVATRYAPPIEITGVDKPLKAIVMQTGEAAPFEYDAATRKCVVKLDTGQLDPMKLSTIVELVFDKEQSFPKTEEIPAKR